MRLLLISSSNVHSYGYLDHPEPEIRRLLDGRKRVAFVRQIAAMGHHAFRAPQRRSRRNGRICRVQVVHPGDGPGDAAIPAVDDRVCARSHPPLDSTAGARQDRGTERMPPERTPHVVYRDACHGAEIGPRTVRHQMHVALARQVRRQCVIGGIHASQRGKVAGDNQPIIQS